MPKEISVVKKRGRPPGALNKKTRTVLEQARKEGITPLEVRLRNMHRWYKLALRSEATGQMQRAAESNGGCCAASQSVGFRRHSKTLGAAAASTAMGQGDGRLGFLAFVRPMRYLP